MLIVTMEFHQHLGSDFLNTTTIFLYAAMAGQTFFIEQRSDIPAEGNLLFQLPTTHQEAKDQNRK